MTYLPAQPGVLEVGALSEEARAVWDD